MSDPATAPGLLREPGPSGAPSTTLPSDPVQTLAAVLGDGGPEPAPEERPAHDRRRRVLALVVVVVLLTLALVAVSAVAVHLLRTSRAWEERAATYLQTSRELGAQVAAARAELSGARSELDAVAAQLTTAHARIVELADEKARLGDDREVQRQRVVYEERVNEAAGKVTLALDECVRGQNQLIGYLQQVDRYDAVELELFAADVQDLCQAATEANMALQRELTR